mgnify:CR=1 FL=1
MTHFAVTRMLHVLPPHLHSLQQYINKVSKTLENNQKRTSAEDVIFFQRKCREPSRTVGNCGEVEATQ